MYGRKESNMPLVRLDKILTDTGLCSRSQAREIIRRGRAAVNGTPCADPAAKFDPEAVSLTVDGEPIDGPGHIYIMLNKPAGVLTATRDPRKPTVVDAMPEDWKRREVKQQLKEQESEEDNAPEVRDVSPDNDPNAIFPDIPSDVQPAEQEQQGQ